MQKPTKISCNIPAPITQLQLIMDGALERAFSVQFAGSTNCALISTAKRRLESNRLIQKRLQQRFL